MPIDLADNERLIEDPWVLIPTLFGECYVGGWTAARHWQLTDRPFTETLVFATRRLIKRRVAAQDANFLLRHVAPTRLFGLETLWRGHTKVTISDAARTLIDLIAMRETGGGIDHVAECLATYLHGQNPDFELLIRYANQYGNGAIFKRLGFLAETRIHHPALTAACRFHRTLGYTRLDPSLPCPNLVTSWNLWVPTGCKASP